MDAILPSHIAIILDGNRRFARKIGKISWEGHELGAEVTDRVVNWCRELGIKYLTLWVFSTENFNRSQEELEKIFDVFVKYSEKFAKDERTHKYRVKLNIIGNISLFPERVRNAVQKAAEATKDYGDLFLNVALGYGGKQEILEGVKNIALLVKKGEISPEQITEALIQKNIYSRDLPPPDLIIRTSGEQRTSGFMLWHSDYSELYFCEKFWPEFEKEDLIKALISYSERQRRFGK